MFIYRFTTAEVTAVENTHNTHVARAANILLSTTTPQTPLKHPLSSAEIRIVKKLYAIGEGAPMIRQQVLDCGLGLDVAEQLEKAEIYDATARGDTGRLISLAVEKLREGKAEQT